ncbi:MAG: hypothetical protein MI861_25180 [Pirellulales bacterium]|nr:hypothetical protein [Pirellulales bacterium]
MRIDVSSTAPLTRQQIRRAEDKNIQSVFSEVLQNAGREGYASAEARQSTEPLEHHIEEAWHRWFQVERTGRYNNPDLPDDLGQAYGGVLSKAYGQGAYVAPKSFLRSLSPGELEAVQRVQGLVDPIRVDTLSEEGALNLLIPPAAQVDLNRDGLTQSGAAYGIRFPNSTTPREVALAWEEVTDGMPESDRMIHELRMVMPVLLSNMSVDSDGTVRLRPPGDPEFSNPMNDSDYSFVGVTESWMAHLDYFRNQIEPERYDKEMAFWQQFGERLIAHGAA